MKIKGRGRKGENINPSLPPSSPLPQEKKNDQNEMNEDIKELARDICD